jgi:hypothetical protein
MRHRAQTTGFRRPLAAPSPFERVTNGRYLVEKLVDSEWRVMSYGDVDHDAGVGRELDRLIQRAEVLEGVVRIVRSKDQVVIWESKEPAPLFVAEELETA